MGNRSSGQSSNITGIKANVVILNNSEVSTSAQIRLIETKAAHEDGPHKKGYHDETWQSGVKVRESSADHIPTVLSTVPTHCDHCDPTGIRGMLSLLFSHRVAIIFAIVAIACVVTSLQISNLENTSLQRDKDGEESSSPEKDKTDADRNEQDKQDKAASPKTDPDGGHEDTRKDNVNGENRPSWEAVARVLTATTSFFPETVKYGEHTFICEARNPNFIKLQLRWKGKCTDKGTGFIAVCQGCLSPTTSVERAAAQLVRDTIERGEYPQPSNTERMPLKCHCPMKYPSAVIYVFECIHSASRIINLVLINSLYIFVFTCVCLCVYLFVVQSRPFLSFSPRS